MPTHVSTHNANVKMRRTVRVESSTRHSSTVNFVIGAAAVVAAALGQNAFQWCFIDCSWQGEVLSAAERVRPGRESETDALRLRKARLFVDDIMGSTDGRTDA